MNITLVLVSSINGKLTPGVDNFSPWKSPADQKHFFSLIKNNSLIIMGRKTYEANKSAIILVPGKLRVVMTNNPGKYKSAVVPGQLEFVNESPKALIQKLEKDGYKKALLVGGNEITKSFLEAKLINTLYLTIEPYLFGKGIILFDKIDHIINLKLLNTKKLNLKGTLLLKYQIIYK
jgi:dihydrofolate reductase